MLIVWHNTSNPREQRDFNGAKVLTMVAFDAWLSGGHEFHSGLISVHVILLAHCCGSAHVSPDMLEGHLFCLADILPINVCVDVPMQRGGAQRKG